MRIFSVALLFCLSIPSVYSQNREDLSVEFGVNKMAYRMSELNDYLKDPKNFTPFTYPTAPNKGREIKSGNDFSFGLNYQPFNCASFGVFTGYQIAEITTPVYLEFEVDPTLPNTVLSGFDELKVSSTSFGLMNKFYLSKFLGLGERRFTGLKSVEINTQVRTGISIGHYENLSFVNFDGQYADNIDFNRATYKGIGFIGKIQFDIGYRFGKTFFSVIGVNLGYQFLKVNDLRNHSESRLAYNTEETVKNISLDFGGFYSGIFLKFGKQ